MKIINKILLLVIFLLLSTQYTFASNLAFIDLDNILQNSNQGQKIIKKFEKRREVEINNIKIKENDIKDLEQEIKKKQNIISQEELKIEIVKLQENIKDFNNYKNKIQSEYKKAKKDEIMLFFNKVDPIIQNYLNDNSIDILFNNKNIVIGKDNLDITDKIIKLVNDKLK